MPKITVYTTPFCPYCIAAKRMLKKKGAKFTDIDVSDESKRQAMIASGLKSSQYYTIEKMAQKFTDGVIQALGD